MTPRRLVLAVVATIVRFSLLRAASAAARSRGRC